MWEDLAFANYVVGQADADSCFYLSVRKRPKRRLKISVDPKWAITKAFDKEILLKIRDFLGVGSVYIKHGSPSRPRSIDPFWQFYVEGKACAVVVEFFERFPLRATKRKDFEIWKKAVAILVGRRETRWTKEDLIAMLMVRKEMDETLVRAKAKKGKIDVSAIIERLQSL